MHFIPLVGGMIRLKGIGVSAGYSVGKAYIICSSVSMAYSMTADNAQAEIDRLKLALSRSYEQIEGLAKSMSDRLSEEDSKIILNQRNYLSDPIFNEVAFDLLASSGASAEKVIADLVKQAVGELEAVKDDYFSERAADVRDVGDRLIQNLCGGVCDTEYDIPEGSIIVAYDLTPSITAQLDVSKVNGIVLEVGGYTSHTAILARALGIAAVTGCTGILSKVKTGDTLAVDGKNGDVFPRPDDKTISAFNSKQAELRKQYEQMQNVKYLKLEKGGRSVLVSANIGTPAEADAARANGADGVGLFRTEFLFMGRTSMPSEQEQFEAYVEVAKTFKDETVIIRTLDIGGDKPLSYLGVKSQQNPFLGVRAIRLCFKYRDVFMAQLRAILRANVHGNVWVMFPMICSLDELKYAKSILQECANMLEKDGYQVNMPKVGIMVEIPSVAIQADEFAKNVDFFSIGTNDLTQYTLAVDRGNAEVAELYDSMHPAVLSLIELTVKAARENGIFCGMCGELAGDERAVSWLYEVGLDEFSVDSSSVAKVKSQLISLGCETKQE